LLENTWSLQTLDLDAAGWKYSLHPNAPRTWPNIMSTYGCSIFTMLAHAKRRFWKNAASAVRRRVRGWFAEKVHLELAAHHEDADPSGSVSRKPSRACGRRTSRARAAGVSAVARHQARCRPSS